MFMLKYFRLLRAYGEYFADLNQYNKLVNELRLKDTREDMVNELFKQHKVYDVDHMNSIILAFHQYRMYFEGKRHQLLFP